MKKNLHWLLAVALLSAATTATAVIVFYPTKVHSEPPQIVEVERKDPLTYQQHAWLGALEWCESRGKPEALNPNDRDNTPSYGILQFKPSTYASFAKLYGLASTTDYKNPAGQIAIVEQMILRGGINWAQQFPDCTKKLGTPPKSPVKN